MSELRVGRSAPPAPADRPRVMRWVAMIALALAAIGVAMQVAGGGFLATLLVMLAMVISLALLLMDTYRAPEQVNARGKSWQPWRARANLQGLVAVGILAMVAPAVFLFSGQLGGWTPETREDWMIFVLATLPVVYAVPLAFPNFAHRALEALIEAESIRR